MTQNEIRNAIRRFQQDENRILSAALLCEAAGISMWTFHNVFKNNAPMSEMVQRRMAKALKAWASGELRIMRNKDRTRYIEYRKEPKPVLQRTMRLQLKNNRISLNSGVRNLNDYTQPSFKEQMED